MRSGRPESAQGAEREAQAPVPIRSHRWGESGPGETDAPPGLPCVRAFLVAGDNPATAVIGLLARTANGKLQPVGQRPPAVSRADGPLVVAVLGGGQDEDYVSIGVRHDGDTPVHVAALLHPLRVCHRAPGHRERMVPERLVAQLDILTEPQLEVNEPAPSWDSGVASNTAVSGRSGVVSRRSTFSPADQSSSAASHLYVYPASFLDAEESASLKANEAGPT